MIAYQERTQAMVIPSLQERAIATYQRTERDRLLNVRMEITFRVRALTGESVAPDAVFVDRESGTATVVVDGVVFRLAQGGLSILRPCANCGTGQFASSAITTVADLHYALAGWKPLHADCQDEDPADIF